MTAQGRLKLYEEIEKLNERVLYFDMGKIYLMIHFFYSKWLKIFYLKIRYSLYQNTVITCQS